MFTSTGRTHKLDRQITSNSHPIFKTTACPRQLEPGTTIRIVCGDLDQQKPALPALYSNPFSFLVSLPARHSSTL